MKEFIKDLDERILELGKLLGICVVKGCEEDGEVKDDNLNLICRDHADKFSQ
jgi:hypothetical protein